MVYGRFWVQGRSLESSSTGLWLTPFLWMKKGRSFLLVDDDDDLVSFLLQLVEASSRSSSHGCSSVCVGMMLGNDSSFETGRTKSSSNRVSCRSSTCSSSEFRWLLGFWVWLQIEEWNSLNWVVLLKMMEWGGSACWSMMMMQCFRVQEINLWISS